MVAKLHKLAERTQEPVAKRLKDKDALDVLRILRAIPTKTLAEGLERLRADTLSGEVTREALAHLETLFGAVSAAGTQMAVRAAERLEDPAEIARSCESLTIELLDAFRM